MKQNIKILFASAVLAIGLNSCYDEKMDWKDNPYGGTIEVSEIPPTLQEQISSLGALKNYTRNYPIGIGAGASLYMEKEDYRNTINNNFQNITVGYMMKHGPMVNTTDGTLRYTAIDNFIARLPEDMGLYGHTLTWHQNQNGAYLRSLIAPSVYPTPSAQNILDLTGLKDKTFTGWSRNNPGAGISVVDNQGVAPTNLALKMISSSSSSQAYSLQLTSPIVTVESGKTYTISLFIRSNQEGKGRISFPKGHDSNPYPYMDWTGTGSTTEAFSTNSAWQNIKFDLTMESNEFQFNIDLGYLPDVTYFVDVENIAVVDSSVELETNTVEKSDAEKKQVVTDAMTYWITEMVGHYKHRVNAWDVVNEPISNDGSGIRHGNYQGDSEDIFHWQDFMGDDYAVEAFKLARAAGKEGDMFFINDFNLEYNLNKCRTLISYVQNIESKGAQVDGIGTQMHISINQNVDDIAEMFRLLATTGKQIKITELDIVVNTASPDAAALQKQAAMYFQVIKLYNEIIPESQQYGVTIWSVTDADSWIEEDAPCLWDAKYNRKPAYKGVADGLAGLQESIEFPEEKENED